MTNLDRAYEKLNAERNRTVIGEDIRVVSLTMAEIEALWRLIRASWNAGKRHGQRGQE